MKISKSKQFTIVGYFMIISSIIFLLLTKINWSGKDTLNQFLDENVIIKIIAGVYVALATIMTLGFVIDFIYDFPKYYRKYFKKGEGK